MSQSAGVVPWFQEYPYPYYHADTTPFWLLALWRQWRASGDRALLDELWPAAQKAWAWCLPHDTDGDGIIENTTGGLGAIEVGSIGEDIHQDVYLAAVWTRAAGAMAEMAAARGEGDLAAQARALEAKARGSIESRYWIEGAGHHAFAVLRSGRTNDTLTVWPATAAAFGLFEPAHARRTLKALSTHALTADWGARMLTTASPLYDPTHYNMGAVWPFVTGFVALGHYQYARPWAGYPLVDALSRLAFDWARGRHPELLSGAYYRPLDTAVPHQFFATSMLASSIAYGLVGWEPDAPAGRARLAPQLPPQWERARVSGLRVGEARLDVAIDQGLGRLSLRLEPRDGPFSLDVRPAWPAGARDVALFVDGTRAEAGEGGGVVVALDGRARVVEARWTGGLAVEAPLAPLDPGQPDRGVRVLDFEATPEGWRLVLEGPAGGSAAVRLHGEAPASARARRCGQRARGPRPRCLFPASSAGLFSTAEVRLHRGRRSLAPSPPPPRRRLDPPATPCYVAPQIATVQGSEGTHLPQMTKASDDRTVTLDIASRFEMLDVVQTVLNQCCAIVGFEEEAVHYMAVAVRESVVNAIKHGNKQDESKRVHVQFTIHDRALEIQVRDEGKGFDPATVADPLAPENLLRAYGRGIFFMRQFMDEVTHSFPAKGGTMVRMLKRAS